MAIICKPIDPNLAVQNYANLEKNYIYIVGYVLELDVDSSNFPNKIPISGDHKPQKTLSWSHFETNVCPPQKKGRCWGLERSSKRGKNPFQIDTWIYPSSITKFTHLPYMLTTPFFALLCFQIVMVSFLFITYASFAEPFLKLQMVHM